MGPNVSSYAPSYARSYLNREEKCPFCTTFVAMPKVLSTPSNFLNSLRKYSMIFAPQTFKFTQFSKKLWINFPIWQQCIFSFMCHNACGVTSSLSFGQKKNPLPHSYKFVIKIEPQHAKKTSLICTRDVLKTRKRLLTLAVQNLSFTTIQKCNERCESGKND